MNLLERLCRELEIEIGKEWEGTDGNIYKIEEDGTLVQTYEFTVLDETTTFKSVEDIKDILTGKIKPKWKPKIGETYYVPEVYGQELYNNWIWEDDECDRDVIKKDIVFKTKEEAIDCAINMIELVKHGI